MKIFKMKINAFKKLISHVNMVSGCSQVFFCHFRFVLDLCFLFLIVRAHFQLLFFCCCLKLSDISIKLILRKLVSFCDLFKQFDFIFCLVVQQSFCSATLRWMSTNPTLVASLSFFPLFFEVIYVLWFFHQKLFVSWLSDLADHHVLKFLRQPWQLFWLQYAQHLLKPLFLLLSFRFEFEFTLHFFPKLKLRCFEMKRWINLVFHLLLILHF
jgi:hypothetical protein